jgi:hypothetical protein
MRVTWLSLAVFLGTLACGGSDAGGAGGSGGAAASGGTGGSAATGGSGASGGSGGGSPCDLPEGSSVVLSARVLGTGSVVRNLVLDGDTLFFGTVDQIYSVAASGGEPTKVYPPVEQVDIYPPFWVRGDELVVGQGDELDVLPKTGGAVSETKPLPAAYSAALTGEVDILLDTDGATFYAKDDPFVLSGDTPSLQYWTYDIETGAGATLLADTPTGHNGRLIKAGGFLYTSERRGAGESATSALHRLPIGGGAFEPVPLTGDFKLEIIGADETHVYVAGSPVPLDVTADQGGFYRLPFAGGAPEKIVDRYIPTVAAVTTFVRTGANTYLRQLDDVYRVPSGSGEAIMLFSSRCELHAMAASADAIYVSTFDDRDDTVQIARVPLP